MRTRLEMGCYRPSHRAASKISRSSATPSAATSLSISRLYVAQRIRGGLFKRRADGSDGRSCSMLGLSQIDRLVLGSDLNRSESRCGALDQRLLCMEMLDGMA
jgi:hypothetical protein